MARNRNLKATFWEDDKLLAVSEGAHMMYAGLWSMCDDYGIAHGSVGRIKKELYYGRPSITEKEIASRLHELMKIKRVHLFCIENEEYLYIPKLLEHQYINRPTKTPNISWYKMIQYVDVKVIPKTYRDGMEVVSRFLGYVFENQKKDSFDLFNQVPSVEKPVKHSVSTHGVLTECFVKTTELSTPIHTESTKKATSDLDYANAVSTHGVCTELHYDILCTDILCTDISKEEKKDFEKNVDNRKTEDKHPTPEKSECVAFFQKMSAHVWDSGTAGNHAVEFFNYNSSLGWKNTRGQIIVNWKSMAENYILKKLKEAKNRSAAPVKQLRGDPGMVMAPGASDYGTQVNKLYQLFLLKGLDPETVNPIHYAYLKHVQLLQITTEDQPDIISRACRIRATQLLSSNRHSAIGLAEYYNAQDINNPALQADLKNFYRITKGLSVQLTFKRLKAMGKTTIDVPEDASKTR